MPSSACKKNARSEEHTSELQSHSHLVCRLLLDKKQHFTLCQGPFRLQPSSTSGSSPTPPPPVSTLTAPLTNPRVCTYPVPHNPPVVFLKDGHQGDAQLFPTNALCQ